jgi:hypothetical protein
MATIGNRTRDFPAVPRQTAPLRAPVYVGRMVKYGGGPGLGLYRWIETGYFDVFLFIFEFSQMHGQTLLQIRPSSLIFQTSSNCIVILVRIYRNMIRKVSTKFCGYISKVRWKNAEVLLTKALFRK